MPVFSSTCFGRWPLAAALLLLSPWSQAAIVFEPLTDLGLSSGDTYRYVFISNTGRDATATDIGTYNAFVQNVADDSGSVFAGSGITWYAIVSTSAVSAALNIGGGLSSPIYLPGGELVADGDADLWDSSLDTTISTNQQGGSFNGYAWTGTNADGSMAAGSYLGSGASVTQGLSLFQNANWMEHSTSLASNTKVFYAISAELEVPAGAAPVPPSAALLGLGIAAVLVSRGRRRR